MIVTVDFGCGSGIFARNITRRAACGTGISVRSNLSSPQVAVKNYGTRAGAQAGMDRALSRASANLENPCRVPLVANGAIGQVLLLRDSKPIEFLGYYAWLPLGKRFLTVHPLNLVPYSRASPTMEREQKVVCRPYVRKLGEPLFTKWFEELTEQELRRANRTRSGQGLTRARLKEFMRGSRRSHLAFTKWITKHWRLTRLQTPVARKNRVQGRVRS